MIFFYSSGYQKAPSYQKGQIYLVTAFQSQVHAVKGKAQLFNWSQSSQWQTPESR